MLKNYLKIAWRTVRKQVGYTVINVGGLALGLAACLVIGLFVQFKLSYDRHLPTSDRMYRMVLTGNTSPDGSPAPDIGRAQPGVGAAVREQVPDIETLTHVVQHGHNLFQHGGESLFIERFFSADEHFFEVFPYRLLQGDLATALDGPGKLVLTASEARRIFGDADPMGQVLNYENAYDLQVTGIVEDPPSHTHFPFDAIRSFTDNQRATLLDEINWSYFGSYVYMLLHEDADPNAVTDKINTFRADNAPEWLLKRGGGYMLEPVSRIHLHSGIQDAIGPQSDVRYLYLFSAIGILILLIAAFNYMNLATARAAGRAREVGVRKVVGAHRGQLIRQFLIESLLLTLLAVPIACWLAELTLPLINQWTGQEISFSYIGQGWLLPVLLGVLLLVGLGAGCYPALFLSRFQPVQVLYGGAMSGRRGAALRKALVVTQFTLSLGLVLAALVVQRQLNYVQEQRLGFDEELVITFQGRYFADQYETVANRLEQSPHVVAATAGSVPGIDWKFGVKAVKDPETGESWELDGMYVNYGYVETLQLSLLQGRDFSLDFPADEEQSVLLNRSAAEQFGIAENPIGQSVPTFSETDKTVIGVVEDFHNASLHQAVRPLMFELSPTFVWTMIVRLAPGNVPERLAAVESIWHDFVPDRPFEYEFLDERIGQQYQAEQRLSRIFSLFSSLAILIACLGLFGLAAFTAASRTKEIGIRKVLGADVSSIVLLLSKDFLRLVLLAAIIAVPLGWWVMRSWLSTFAYHIPTPWLTFGLLAGIALLLTFATVSYQSIRAALANPVKSLRYE